VVDLIQKISEIKFKELKKGLHEMGIRTLNKITMFTGIALFSSRPTDYNTLLGIITTSLFNILFSDPMFSDLKFSEFHPNIKKIKLVLDFCIKKGILKQTNEGLIFNKRKTYLQVYGKYENGLRSRYFDFWNTLDKLFTKSWILMLMGYHRNRFSFQADIRTITTSIPFRIIAKKLFEILNIEDTSKPRVALLHFPEVIREVLPMNVRIVNSIDSADFIFINNFLYTLAPSSLKQISNLKNKRIGILQPVASLPFGFVTFLSCSEYNDFINDLSGFTYVKDLFMINKDV